MQSWCSPREPSYKFTLSTFSALWVEKKGVSNVLPQQLLTVHRRPRWCAPGSGAKAEELRSEDPRACLERTACSPSCQPSSCAARPRFLCAQMLAHQRRRNATNSEALGLPWKPWLSTAAEHLQSQRLPGTALISVSGNASSPCPAAATGAPKRRRPARSRPSLSLFPTEANRTRGASGLARKASHVIPRG